MSSFTETYGGQASRTNNSIVVGVPHSNPVSRLVNQRKAIKSVDRVKKVKVQAKHSRFFPSNSTARDVAPVIKKLKQAKKEAESAERGLKAAIKKAKK